MGLRKFFRITVPRSAWPPAVLLAAATLLLLFGEDGREFLRYERPGIGDGEIWRLATAHIVHLGWTHFAMNAAGLVLVWFIVGSAFSVRQWCIAGFIIVVFIDAGLWLLSPVVWWYVGLSGLLHGILAAGLVAGLPRPRAEVLVLGVLLVVKLAWEQISGPLPGSAAGAGGNVIVDAHLYGAAGGVIAALFNRATASVAPRI